jgi:phytoene synthase
MLMLSSRDLRVCRDRLRAGSRSFYAASLMLPRRVRDPATALYAFCRDADDRVDGSADPAAALAGLHGRVERAYAGQPADDPVDRALADTVARYDVPRVLVDALLEGFAWDAEGRRYADLADLEAYAVRVAGVVGIMMAVLMGRRSAAVLSRACDLGIAMQLTNIARDVGEDAAAGRVYLPENWLTEARIERADLIDGSADPAAVAEVVRRLLGAAEVYYGLSVSGINALPADCRPAIRAAGLIYREIGREVERAGFDSLTRRAVVSGRRKIALLAQAWTMAERVSGLPSTMAASSATALVEAAAVGAIGGEDGRIGWVLDLFSALDQRDRHRRSGITASA